MGDFNATMSPELDRPTSSKNYCIDLSAWAQAMGLVEIWRWKHPSTRAYSCFSASYKTASRIDLAFSNPALLADVLEATYLPSGLSDHSPLAVVFRSPTSRSAGLWRLGSPIQISEKIPLLLTEFWEQNTGSSSPDIIWDAFKAYTRGQYISSIANIKKQQKTETQSLQQSVTDHTTTDSSDATPAHFDQLMAVQRDLQLHLTEVTRLEIYKGKRRTFEQGYRNGCLLAMMAQHDQPHTLISTLQTPEGGTVTSPSHISQTFNTFYETLYTSSLPSDFQPKSLNVLLDPLALGWLSDQERDSGSTIYDLGGPKGHSFPLGQGARARWTPN